MAAAEQHGFTEPRLHAAALDERDLDTLLHFGVRSVIAVADNTAHPASPAGLLRHFDELLNVQLPRLVRCGLRARVALGVHPLVLPRRGLRQVLDALPGYLKGGRVAALGLTGLIRGDAHEEEALLAQLAFAAEYRLPAIITTPRDGKEPVTRATLAALQRSELPAAQVLVEGATGRTLRTILGFGFHGGLTLHPDHLTVENAVKLVRAHGAERLMLCTGAGDGASDILALARAAHRLERAKLSAGVIRRVTCSNATDLFKLD